MRMFHALFALSFLGAYLSADEEGWRALHVALGYSLLGLLVFRLAYGLLGPRPARLSVLWRQLAGLPGRWRALRSAPDAAGAPDLHWAALGRQGQHLVMALVVATLLTLVLPLVFSGVASFHEWGGPWWTDALEEVHEALGEGFALVVLAHVGLVVGLSWWRRQNLARPMLTGRAPGPGPDLVKHPQHALALALLACVLGWLAWSWHQAPGDLVPREAFSAVGWTSPQAPRQGLGGRRGGPGGRYPADHQHDDD